MNIFAVDRDPIIAARMLPDRHVTKMILESAQMLSIVFSAHYWDIGEVMKVDGTPFKTAKGAFKKHPCTMWAADSTTGPGLSNTRLASAKSSSVVTVSSTALASHFLTASVCSTVTARQ